MLYTFAAMLKLALLDNKPEIFHSIQGEGKSIGRPSVFIRLSLCNLYCAWCDTAYTWNWENTPFSHNNDFAVGFQKYKKSELIIRMSNEEIAAEVSKAKCNNLIITGGEPLVQQKDLESLLALLKEKNAGYRIEFETNGTFKPSAILDSLSDQYNVSIKLSNSKVDTAHRINPEAISFFAASEKSNFKFVIDIPRDLEEVLRLTEDFNIAHERLYLMPQGISAAGLQEKQQWVADICKEYNFNYTDRLHIHIWGAKRGI